MTISKAPPQLACQPSVTVIVPSHVRPALLVRCVRALAQQTTADAFEILIGLDGPEPETVQAVHAAWGEAPHNNATLDITEFQREGANEIRQQLLERARGDLVITLNDDVAPEPEFIDAHRARHERSHAAGKRDVVIGVSPDIDHPEPTLVDRVVAHTTMVFPWVRMLENHAHDPEHDHTYRAAVTLNFSARREDLLAVGGFTPSAGVYGHDDLELGYRMATQLGSRVLFEPAAIAPHEHRHTARGLLERDARLGASLWHYAQTRGAFARDLVGHDATDPGRMAFYRQWLDTDRRDAQRTARRWLALSDVPWDAIGTDASGVVVGALGDQHLPARRWLWRQALLDASEAQCRGVALASDYAKSVVAALLDT